MIPRNIITFLVSFFVFSPIWSAKAPSSKQQLEKIATHIVVGNVQAIYSYKQSERIPLVSGYVYDRKVAEIKIKRIEKGKIAENLVYARYWSRSWKGIGLPPPGGQSYDPQPKVGQTCRFYLAKNASDGWSSKDSNQDGGYNVLYVNGVEPISK